jgi:hypothetical protein
MIHNSETVQVSIELVKRKEQIEGTVLKDLASEMQLPIQEPVLMRVS